MTDRPPSWTDIIPGDDEEKLEILELLLKNGNHRETDKLGIKEEMERIAGRIAERILLDVGQGESKE